MVLPSVDLEILWSGIFGLNCENGNPEDLTVKLRILIENEHQRSEKDSGARKCAVKRFDRRNTYKGLAYAI